MLQIIDDDKSLLFSLLFIFCYNEVSIRRDEELQIALLEMKGPPNGLGRCQTQQQTPFRIDDKDTKPKMSSLLVFKRV
jgi:hypothetical protein